MALLEKSILSRPRGASHRSIEPYDFTLDNFELNKGGAEIRLNATTPRLAFGVMRINTGRGFRARYIKSALSARIAQPIAGWEQIQMAEKYSRSLSFDDTLQCCRWPTVAKSDDNRRLAPSPDPKGVPPFDLEARVSDLCGFWES